MDQPQYSPGPPLLIALTESVALKMLVTEQGFLG